MSRKKYLDLYIRLVVKFMYPFSIVEDESFGRLSKATVLKLSRHPEPTLKAGIIAKAKYAKALLKEMLQ